MKSYESLKSNDFKTVYEGGRSLADRRLVLYTIKNEGRTEKNGLGISVSKKIGNSVVRHRITRLVRESYRLNADRFNSGLDMVVIARRGAAGVGYREIEESLLNLAKKAKICKMPHSGCGENG